MRARSVIPGAVLALACALPGSATENRGYGLSVVIDGNVVPEHAFGGRVYIEALKGLNFTLRLSNPTNERVAVALSVDGRNVMDARRTTAQAATKWLLEPWQTVEIPGWQISGETSRRFFFTETGRSYAKWLGDTSNVGTIEAAFFREKRQRIAHAERITVDRRAVNPQSAAGESGPAGPAATDSSTRSADAPRDAAKAQALRSSEADSYAATGIGDRTSFPVIWVDFQEEPAPVATVALRYEFRPELVRLGVLANDGDLWARDRAHGFERKYAPSPER
jgi:hypothetical protein